MLNESLLLIPSSVNGKFSPESIHHWMQEEEWYITGLQKIIHLTTPSLYKTPGGYKEMSSILADQ
jgi:hypothetical protein